MDRRETTVHRLSMSHPGDVAALGALIERGEVDPRTIVAVIGKTEGNGGSNDFTRGYFTQSLLNMLAACLDESPQRLAERIPCVLSGGTEGVLSPHYTVFCREPGSLRSLAGTKSLAIGTAFTAPTPPEDIGRLAHARAVRAAVLAAMADAGLDDPADVRFVQIKGPCVTTSRAQTARGNVRTANAGKSMAYTRAAGALGVALALGELAEGDVSEDDLLGNFALYSARASVSSGVEVVANEVIVLGNSTHWSGSLRIASRPMEDALDITSVYAVLDDLGIRAFPQLSVADRKRVHATLVKCEPDRRGMIHGARHTMLDDIDIDAQRHIRAAVGGMVAGVLGDTRLFVSGGAEHQGPNGGGLIAVIAAR